MSVQCQFSSLWRNINNLRYADDTTLMAESEEELKSLLMKVKEGSETAGLKHNIVGKCHKHNTEPDTKKGSQTQRRTNSDSIYMKTKKGKSEYQ